MGFKTVNGIELKLRHRKHLLDDLQDEKLREKRINELKLEIESLRKELAICRKINTTSTSKNKE